MVLIIAPDDSRLGWYGAVSFERSGGWTKPWRIPFERRRLFGRVSAPDMLLSRAGMSAGVRIAFRSTTESVAGSLEPLWPDPFAVEQAQAAKIDLCCDGVLVGSYPLLQETRFSFPRLAAGEKTIELWLPEYREIRLRSIELDEGATLARYDDDRPRWLVHGSSNTQSRGAESPVYTWPAVAARKRGLNHMNLAYGGQCHLDSMVARMLRDLPADLIALEIGINIYINATLNPRSLRAALIGFVEILREKHLDTPIAVMSAIFSPPREDVANAVGMTLAQQRTELAEAVADMRESGDSNVHYVNGLDLFGADMADELPDELHPSAAGYKVLGERFADWVAAKLLP